jgi:hypothetical protein
MTVLSKRKREESSEAEESSDEEESESVVLCADEELDELLRVCANGDIFRVANGSYAKPWENEHGYSLVSIGGKRHRVHRIVCRAFHGDMSEDKPHVNHKNGVRADNSAANLEWTSIEDNIRHSFVNNKDRKSNAPKMSLAIIATRGEEERRAFASTSDAARKLTAESEGLKFNAGSISAVLSGKQKKVRGWTFERAEDPDLPGEVWYEHPTLPIMVSNMERYQLLSRASPKVHLGSGRHTVGVGGSSYPFHHLVWEAYYKQLIPEGLEIDHIDELTRSNRPEKLQLATPSENIKNSYDRGHRALSSKAIIAIDPKSGKETQYISVKAAAAALEIDPRRISQVLMGKQKTAGKKGFTFRFVDTPKKMPAADGTTRDITIASVVKIRLESPTRKKPKKVVE